MSFYRPGQEHVGRTTSFVEFVDIFPTLSDLAGIPVPPLCPPDSRDVQLCTEGVSLKPIFANSSCAFLQFPWPCPAIIRRSQCTRRHSCFCRAQVKRASFSQYPHATHGVGNGDASSPLSSAAASMTECPSSVVGGEWHDVHGDTFQFDISKPSTVKMDIRGCHHCSFQSAEGVLLPDGVELVLRFSAGCVARRFHLQSRHAHTHKREHTCANSTKETGNGSEDWVRGISCPV